jgi:heme/copper-type cytochrome/quinol oxidase subunit 4
VKAKSAEHTAGNLLTAAMHHPVPALIVVGIVVVVLWVAKRRLFGSVPIPESTTVVTGDGFGIGVVLALLFAWVMLGSTSTQVAAPVKAARPVIKHITHITHVTHISQAAPHGMNGWLIAFIAAVAVACLIWLFRKLTGR